MSKVIKIKETILERKQKMFELKTGSKNDAVNILHVLNGYRDGLLLNRCSHHDLSELTDEQKFNSNIELDNYYQIGKKLANQDMRLADNVNKNFDYFIYFKSNVGKNKNGQRSHMLVSLYLKKENDKFYSPKNIYCRLFHSGRNQFFSMKGNIDFKMTLNKGVDIAEKHFKIILDKSIDVGNIYPLTTIRIPTNCIYKIMQIIAPKHFNFEIK